MKDYRALLESAVAHSYEPISVLNFHRLDQAGGIDPGRRYLILRHDIDTDPDAAREFWQIECDFGATASHYFRLCTLSLDLMNQIEDSGGEASYHYEEIATVAKEECLRTRAEVTAAMPRIRERFARNYQWLQKVSGLQMKSVASHGDFVNRKLLISNDEILVDQDLRDDLGIELETYDDDAQVHICSRHSDHMRPKLWHPSSPFEAIEQRHSVVYLLTHPRHFRCRIAQNLSCDMRRLYEGICFKHAMRSRHRVMRQPIVGE